VKVLLGVLNHDSRYQWRPPTQELFPHDGRQEISVPNQLLAPRSPIFLSWTDNTMTSFYDNDSNMDPESRGELRRPQFIKLQANECKVIEILNLDYSR
jgi:hypothetical protein